MKDKGDAIGNLARSCDRQLKVHIIYKISI
jgi:hypothetical protein